MFEFRRVSALFGMCFILGVGAVRPAQGGTFSVIYNFPGGAGGYQPVGALVPDGAGDFDGQTQSGGAYGGGVLFQLAADGTVTPLASFLPGAAPGFVGDSPLVLPNGTIFGADLGQPDFNPGYNFGPVVYALVPGMPLQYYVYNPGNPYGHPIASGLIADQAGSLFGVSSLGGTDDGGTIFKLSPPSYSQKVLYNFHASAKTGSPSRLVRDNGGNFYGIEPFGCCGAVFKLSADGTFTILLEPVTISKHSVGFSGDLLLGSDGFLYGTAVGTAKKPAVGGAVFKLSKKGHVEVLHRFGVGTDGFNPNGSLVQDGAGNLYGTTSGGGSFGYGVVFEVSPARVETVLYNFSSADGVPKSGNGLVNVDGVLLGMTQANATNTTGEIYTITP